MPALGVTCTPRPSTPIAIIRRRVVPAELGRAVQADCGAVWAELRAQGVRGGRNVALYWDDRVSLEAGVEVDGPFEARAGLLRSGTPAGLVAAVLHFGPYHMLGDAYEAIQTWVRSNGYRGVGPRWETYGHWQPGWDADPGRIETEVACLVEPR